MKAAYELAGDGVRRRVMERARQAGRVEWVGVASGGRQVRRVGEATTLSVLLFTGYTWEEVQRVPQAAALLASVDVLSSYSTI